MTKAELQAELDRALASHEQLVRYIDALRQAVAAAPGEGLTARDQSARVSHKMEAQIDAKHPGRKITSTGPVALAAKNSGQSIRGIAAAIGVGWSALKMADKRGRAVESVRLALAKPPYLVPPSAWKA